jgi:RecA-family ATPase
LSWRGSKSVAVVIPNPPLLRFHAITGEPLRPLEWDVEPLFARCDRVVLYGDFGSLKSWMLLELAEHVATGRDWLGFRVPAPRRVLYIDEEQPERVLRRRVRRLAEGAGIPLGREVPFAAFSRIGFRFTEYGVGQLQRALERAAFQPEVVIVETLARVLDGDESHNPHIAQFWSRVDALCRAGVSVLVSHHMGKPPTEGVRALRYRARGAVDILAGADVAIAVEGSLANHCRVRVVKNREAKLVDPFTVELKDLAQGADCPVRLQRVRGAGPTLPLTPVPK